MILKKSFKNFLIFILFLILLNCPGYSEKSDTEKKQEIYFYAVKYFNEGKYEKSIEEFKKILEISPGHQESIRMIQKNRQRIELTRKMLDDALKKYNEGALREALLLLENAYRKDSGNFKIRSLLSKVLTELGIEYSLTGDHKNACIYFKKALKFSPEDKEIIELISISKSMIGQGIEDEDYREENTDQEEKAEQEKKENEKLEEMMAVFEKYQKSQNKLMQNYFKVQEEFKKMMERSEKEKLRLYSMLKAQEEEVKNLLQSREKQTNIIYENIKKSIFIAGGALLFVFIFIGTALLIKGKSNGYSKGDLKELLASVEKIPKEEISDFDKKIKKLQIIESEFSEGSPEENQMGLKLLNSFLNDEDLRIQLQAVKILHKINSKQAVKIIVNLLKKNKAEARYEVCKALGSLVSRESIDTLIKLSSVKDEKIKKISVSALAELANRKNVPEKIKKTIKVRLAKIGGKDKWIVS